MASLLFLIKGAIEWVEAGSTGERERAHVWRKGWEQGRIGHEREDRVRKEGRYGYGESIEG